ncbi:MAG TPA: glycosyltransferase, partial [Hyphomicrobium sp.]|nr:glycosyltransferase [Hyphomicrobium sp.]
VGSAGRLEEVKGHRVLVAAMPSLPETTHVVLVGDGSQRTSLVAQARELGVAQRLHLLGHRDDLEQILPAFNVFCLPSLGEGLPRVLMEAQAADIPVVASDVGSVRQAVDPATGRLVRSNDPIELGQALTKVLASPPPENAARTYAAERFGIDRLVEAYDRKANELRAR